MQSILGKLAEELAAHGEPMPYGDFLELVPPDNRNAVVDAARKKFKFALTKVNGVTVHTVSLRQS